MLPSSALFTVASFPFGVMYIFTEGITLSMMTLGITIKNVTLSIIYTHDDYTQY